MTDEQKKDLLKFDSWTDRDKANTNVSQASSILGSSTLHTPAKEVHFEFKHFLSHALWRREMNSLEVLSALHHLSVRHAEVYPADRLLRVWTRSTVIVANTDDHDRLGQHWVAFYIDEHKTGTYFDTYGLPPLDPRFLLRLRRNFTTYRWNTTTL